MSDQTEHEELGPMIAPDSLGEVADFLEQHGQPGPAAAVRTLEWMAEAVVREYHEMLARVCVALHEEGQSAMAAEIQMAWDRLGIATSPGSQWNTPRSTPLEDMRRMRDQIHANSIGTLAIDGYRITREPGPVPRPIEGTYPLGSPRRVIADWLDARGLAGTGLRVDTQEGPPIDGPRVEIIMRRGDKFSLRRLEELDMVYLRSARDMVEILDDLYLRLCRRELTTA